VGEGTVDQKRKRYLLGIVIAAVLGFGFSAELLRIHVSAMKDPDFDAACHFSQTVDCVSVSTTQYAFFFGVPNALFGMIFYLLLAGLALLQIRPLHRIFAHSRNAIFFIAVWDAAYSVYLALISALVLKTLCPYCTGLYAVNLAILILSALTLDPWRQAAAQVRDDVKLIFSERILFIIAVAGLLLLAGAAAWQNYRLQNQREQRLQLAFGQAPITLDLSGDPVTGPATAPVTIVEFTDYQCPHCQNLERSMVKALKRYQGRIRVINKNFPLNSDCNPAVKTKMHPDACVAAITAECANYLGRFQELKPLLFATEDLSWPNLMRLSEQVGLHEPEMIACVKSGYPQNKVAQDVRDGLAIDLKSTPAILVNGHLFHGAKTFDDLKAIIDAALHGAALPPD
jgi:protein-disulfide isomerase